MKPQHTVLTREQWQKENKRWVDPFSFELRMRNVPGSEVGQQLETVYSHCVDSGETPEEAFGKPVEYARSLELGHDEKARERMRDYLPSLLALVLFLVFSQAVDALGRDGAFQVNDLMLFSWGAVCVISCLMIIFLKHIVEKISFHMAGMALVGVLTALGVLSTPWNRPVLFEANPLLVIAITGVLIVAIATFLTLKTLYGPDSEEVADIAIQYPTDSEHVNLKRTRGMKTLLIAIYWIIPALAFIQFALNMFVSKG